MNATLLSSPSDEIFRGDPSPEVDAAWRRISSEQPVAITRDEVLALGKDPDKAVRYPKGFNGTGDQDDLYAGRIDVFHQIHCLDALRREAHFDHYYGQKYPNLNATNNLHKAHLSHCVYYLLQNIMCQASVDVYTHVWTDTLMQPFPDFQIEHKCRSFDAILDWQDNNALDLHEFYQLRRPSDSDPLEMSAEFKELWAEYEFYNPEADHHHDGGQIG
ncbi:unnamed protein product [Discula destructiva]